MYKELWAEKINANIFICDKKVLHYRKLVMPGYPIIHYQVMGCLICIARMRRISQWSRTIKTD